MKRNIYLLLMSVIFLGSCKNIEKMVKKGEYDKAILYAAEELQDRKEKETKFVVALEDAFSRVMERDFRQIERLKDRGESYHYGRIYDLYQKISLRQKKITPFLPLTSKDGYTATFQMIDPRPFLKEYAEKDSKRLYNEAIDLLDAYSEADKGKARSAYKALRGINKYYDNYLDKDELLQKAYELGVEHILVYSDTESGIRLRNRQLKALESLEINHLDKKWIKFHESYAQDFIYDYEVELLVKDIAVDRERESVDRSYFEKEIQDGERYVLDSNGNVAKDSLGNDITEPNYILAKAEVIEVARQKAAEVIAEVRIIDLHRNVIVDEQRIVTPIIFEGYSLIFSGDKRAIAHNVLCREDNFLEGFPHDDELVYEGIKETVTKARRFIGRAFS